MTITVRGLIDHIDKGPFDLFVEFNINKKSGGYIHEIYRASDAMRGKYANEEINWFFIEVGAPKTLVRVILSRVV